MSNFITTTDIINRLNASLDDAGEFQLHTRLPDGSARASTRSEQAAADFGAKLQQAAAFVQTLTRQGQLQWADLQRLEGNELFHKKSYEDAIDVYLTCLTVASNNNNNNNNSNNCDRKNEEDDADELQQQRMELFYKIMNNLALCTLQLKWYRKTVDFCTMALQEKNQSDDDYDDDDDGVFQLEKAKLYYKRAKASRLRGDYRVEDIEKAKDFLQKSDHALEPTLNQAIEREHRLLQGAMAEAAANEKRQEASMRRLLTTPIDSEGIEPLYGSASIPDREFSTIRAPKLDHSLVRPSKDETSPMPSYWTMYTSMVQRQARQWLGRLSIQKKKTE